MLRTHSRIVLLLLVLLSLGLVWSGCSRDDQPATPENPGAAVPIGDESSAPFRAAIGVQKMHTPALMAMPNVVGTAITMLADGSPALMILTIEPMAKGALPFDLEGLPIVEEVSGIIRPMVDLPMASDKAGNTAKQTPPISLGTSGGWRYDLANGYCCGGTLGSLVTNGTTQYVLSNYHVLEADIVSGGNSRIATTGDFVIQPGLIDVACNAATAQNVGTLVVRKSLPNNNVDCAIAQVISGMVRTDGAILGIGTISKTPIAAVVNMAVKKAGRTTGLTTSTISGLNATISVAYENECAGGAAFTKTFTGQIVIKNSRSKFLAGGDSGSLMVQNIATNPKPVGLLFAGSSTTAIANPIGQVLSFLGTGWTMVGI
jgi:hypothetical protein